MVEYLKEVNCRKTVVCEKTDGVRFFLCEMIRKVPNQPHVDSMWLLVDRKYVVRQVSLRFDLDSQSVESMTKRFAKGKSWVVRNILDGELVWDTLKDESLWRTKHPNPIFLVFDALVINGTNLMPMNFTNRLTDADAYVRSRFLKARVLNKEKVPVANGIPTIDMYMKEMFRIQDAHVLFQHVLPRLEHENDGLIFTVDAAPYYMGSSPHILKWKPMRLNTIDFNARPLNNPKLPLVWSLHCQKGELYDFIVFTEAQRVEYLAWFDAGNQNCVVECNYRKDFGSPGAAAGTSNGENEPDELAPSPALYILINSLKSEHGVEDEAESAESDED